MSNESLIFDEIVIDLASRRVTYVHKEVPLSKLEFDLLAYLAQRANQVCPYDKLLDEVWGYEADEGTPRPVQFAAYRLAKNTPHDRLWGVLIH